MFVIYAKLDNNGNELFYEGKIPQGLHPLTLKPYKKGDIMAKVIEKHTFDKIKEFSKVKFIKEVDDIKIEPLEIKPVPVQIIPEKKVEKEIIQIEHKMPEVEIINLAKEKPVEIEVVSILEKKARMLMDGTVTKIKSVLSSKDAQFLELCHNYERKNKNRKTILRFIESI